MKRIIILSLFVCFPMVIQAADLPDVVNANKANDEAMCIQRAANDCVNTICANSPELHCTDNCQTAAQNKCKELSE